MAMIRVQVIPECLSKFLALIERDPARPRIVGDIKYHAAPNTYTMRLDSPRFDGLKAATNDAAVDPFITRREDGIEVITSWGTERVPVADSEES
jgi:hypothetical protein